jgi:hypothetical protein
MKAEKERHLADERGGGGGGGAKSYDREKAWSSVNHSILSDTSKVSNCYIQRRKLRERGKDGRHDGCVGLEEENGKSVAFFTHSLYNVGNTMNTEKCRYDYANLKPVASITGYDNLPVNNQQAVLEHLATVSCLPFSIPNICLYLYFSTTRRPSWNTLPQ